LFGIKIVEFSDEKCNVLTTKLVSKPC